MSERCGNRLSIRVPDSPVDQWDVFTCIQEYDHAHKWSTPCDDGAGTTWAIDPERKVVITSDMELRAAHALMRDDPEAENGTYGLEDYLAMARAALEAALGGE